MANNLATLRIKHGLTQKAFGEKVGMATHAVGYSENHRCSVDLAQKTSTVLGENVFEVLGSDVLRVLPQTEEDKQILIKMIKEL